MELLQTFSLFSGLVAVLRKESFLDFRHHEVDTLIEGILDGFWIVGSLNLEEDPRNLAGLRSTPADLVLLDKVGQFLVHWCKELIELPPGLGAHLSMGACIFHSGLFLEGEAAWLDSKTLADELKCLLWLFFVLLKCHKCELRWVVLLQPLLEVTCIHGRPDRFGLGELAPPWYV